MMATSLPKSGGNRWFVVLVIAMLVAGSAVVALLASNRTAEVLGEQTAPVTVSGDTLGPLPAGVQLTDAATDPESGAMAPMVAGSDFEGNDVSIEADGRAKAIYFLAHWCPHCQDEVPVIRDLLAEGQRPDDLDVYVVSTAVDPTQGNYPPEAWLLDEGLDLPLVRDDDDSTALASYGGSSFPYAVYLNADHEVVARSSGQVGSEAIAELWLNAAGQS